MHKIYMYELIGIFWFMVCIHFLYIIMIIIITFDENSDGMEYYVVTSHLYKN